MIYTISGTILMPDNSPAKGIIYFKLQQNVNLSYAVVLASKIGIELDATGSFVANLYEGTYTITLPNLTNLDLVLDSDKRL